MERVVHTLNVDSMPDMRVGEHRRTLLLAGHVDVTRKILEVVEAGRTTGIVLEVVSDGPMKGDLLHLRGPSARLAS